MNLDDLKKPFPPDRISWRVGSTTKDKSKGMALAYIDARDVQDRLDEVCGPAGWQNRYIPMHDKKTVCEVGIWVNDAWIWKSDGAGDSDVEAEKGSLSDAFKRAAVKWGIGRYLYDVEAPWVEVETYEKNGQLFVKGIKDHEYKRLAAILAGKAAPSSPPATSQLTPQAWTQMGIDRVSGFTTLSDLDAFEKRFSSKIVQVAPLVPDLHAKLITLMADKRAELEP